MVVSIKEVGKLLTNTFHDPNVSTPLPEELINTIDQFLSTHQDIDDSDSQRLHEELLSIYNKHVVGDSEKHGLFVAVLRSLRPAIRGDKRLEEWWNLVIRPTIDAIGHKRDIIEDAREFLLGILVFNAEDDTTSVKATLSAAFTKRLIDAYLVRTRIPSGDDIVSPEDEFIAHELETILVAFGRRNPKELLNAIDEVLVDRDYRLQALSLLSGFVRLQPPHLYLVLQTSIIGHLHACLLLDNSTTVVDLALTILIMFIPHITTTLVADLPRLFVIYARILCWDQYNKGSNGHATQSEYSEPELNFEADNKQALHFDPHWDIVEATMDGAESPPPKANYLFTFLYGLFPLNFMNYIRKPRRYLKMKAYQNADDLDLFQNLIKSRTEIHRAQHKLHPSFFSTTPEDELLDNKWLKSDPADLVSECLGLCIAVGINFGDPGPPPSQKLPALPKKPRSVKSRIIFHAGEEETLGNAFAAHAESRQSRPSSSCRNTLNTTLSGTTATLPIDLAKPRQSSTTSLVGLAKSPKSSSPISRFLSSDDIHEGTIDSRPHTPRLDRLPLSTSAPPSPPRSVISAQHVPKIPSLQSFAQTLSRFPLPNASFPGAEVYNTAMLQREVMLLKNDLNFERYQKQKYVEQLGSLQRKHMSEVALEADGQTILNKNRVLKSQLGRTEERYEQLKKEMAVSRNQAKKFEDQLTARLKTYREEEKQWKMDVQTLQHDLEMTKMECEDLRKLVIESEAREQDGKNELNIMSVDVDEVSALRSKIVALEGKVQAYEQRDFDYERTLEEHNILQAELETTRMRLASTDSEKDRMRRQYDQRIMILEANNRNAQLTVANSTTLPNSVQQMIDSAVALQQSKFQQLKKNYTNLHHRFVELEMRNQDLENGITEGPRPGSVLSLTRYADNDGPSRDSFMQGTHLARARSSRRHDFAISEEPEMSGGILTRTASGGLAANATHPLPSSHDFVVSPTGSTFASDGIRAPATIKVSETRAFGRGGAGNMKKPKDKDKERDAKKGGFRGLKGII